MFKLVAAKPEEAPLCYALIEEGRAFQRAQGFVQWTDAYPNLGSIEEDIAAKRGYVLKNESGDIAGYICIDFTAEPAYETIYDGQWRTQGAHAVLHRMAMNSRFRGCGLGKLLIAECDRICLEKNVRCIRCDTSPENTRMQHVFEKNGYVRCGLVTLRGSAKIAYDKLLD